MGVVLIHCNLSNDTILSPGNMTGIEIVELISKYLCSCCVPSFFIISGFLFFRNVPKDSGIGDFFPLYIRKLKSRAHTLIIPYLLWNIIGMMALLFKCYFFNLNSLGVIVDGSIQWGNFFRGFLYLENGLPYDFPLWFIRNLIGYVLISPIFFICARKTPAFLISFTILILLCHFSMDIDFCLLSFFLIGSYLGLHKKCYVIIKKSSLGFSAVVLWIGLSVLRLRLSATEFDGNVILSFLSNLAGCLGVIWVSDKFIRSQALNSQSIFFIYAVHGLYCSQVRRIMISLIGSDSTPRILISYVATFIFLVSSSLIVYYLLKNLTPRLVGLLAGGRSY
ncbi:MAG: acyltransferase [Muribaculaceae bacterium]|nr:acyltransferase [Muribaculaceae bacterium]